MAIRDADLQFSSFWEIDQRAKTGTKAVGAGATLLDIASTNLPVTEVQFQPTGSSRWYSPGTNTTAETVGSNFTFYSYVNGANLYIQTGIAGTARYYIYTDKVDY